MSDNRDRRKLLQALGVFGATQTVPHAWVKPTIDTVVLPSHAATTAPGDIPEGTPEGTPPPETTPPMDDGPPPLNCEITRGEEGSAPRVMGGNFIIDTTIELFDEGIAVGDTLDARHQVAAAGFDETYASNVNESIGRLFGSGLVPFSIPLPPGVVPGQQLVITVTMTSGAFAGSSCSESLEIL